MYKKLLLTMLFLILAFGIGSKAQQPDFRIGSMIAVLDIQCGEGVDKKIATPLTNVII